LNGTAIQADGKMVAVGDGPMDSGGLSTIEVLRLNTDGSLDTTFNGTGGVNIDMKFSSYGNGVAIQPDGKILICGEAFLTRGSSIDSEYFVVRLNADGSLDNTFASHGTFVWNPTSGRQLTSKMLVLSDGSILVGGIAPAPGSSGNFIVFKLTSSGKLDKSFGSGGEFSFGPNNAGGGTNALALAPNGDIILAGTTHQSSTSGPDVGCLVAVTPSGQLDVGFNGTGFLAKLPTGYASQDFDDMVLQNGAILVSGQATPTGGLAGGFLARYSLSGALDTTFGSAGMYFTNNVPVFAAIALESDGSIIAGGDNAIAHLSADGVIDTAFGNQGNGFSTFSGSVSDLAITSDGRIFVCGGNTFARFTSP
jgi:uncharacterized delta-60 repeat protein